MTVVDSGPKSEAPFRTPLHERAIWCVFALSACSSSHGKTAPPRVNLDEPVLQANHERRDSDRRLSALFGASLIAPSAILAPYMAWFEVDHAKIEDGRFVVVSGLTQLRSGKPAFTPKTAFTLHIGGSIESRRLSTTCSSVSTATGEP